MGRRLLYFIVYRNSFIAACALLLTLETFVLPGLPSSLNWYLLLIFLCTVFVYSFHYFVKSKKEKTDHRLKQCRKNEKLLLIIITGSSLFITGGVANYLRHEGLMILKALLLIFAAMILLI